MTKTLEQRILDRLLKAKLRGIKSKGLANNDFIKYQYGISVSKLIESLLLSARKETIQKTYKFLVSCKVAELVPYMGDHYLYLTDKGEKAFHSLENSSLSFSGLM
jgi:hypothetical protein